MAGSDKKTFGEPDKWRFEYPWSLVKIGMWLWAMSDFQHFPSQDEITKLDPRWISDMQLAYQLYSFQKNDDPIMKLYDTAMSNRSGQGKITSEQLENMSDAYKFQ